MKSCRLYHSQSVAVSPDRRKQDRRQTTGEVLLLLDRGVEVTAQLRDESDCGFRAIHNYRLMESGQEVRYRTEASEGKARVVWCRIGGNECESGFYIL